MHATVQRSLGHLRPEIGAAKKNSLTGGGPKRSSAPAEHRRWELRLRETVESEKQPKERNSKIEIRNWRERERKAFNTEGTKITEEERLCVLRVSVVRRCSIYRHGRWRPQKKNSTRSARRSRRKRDSERSVSLWRAVSSFTASIYKCGGASRAPRLGPALRDEAVLLSPESFHSFLVMSTVVRPKVKGDRQGEHCWCH